MINLRILLLFATVVLFANAVSAQTEIQDAERRNAVAQINRKLPKLTKKNVSVDGISSEGAEAAVYLDGAAIVKIAAQIFGETGRSNVEFYYQNNNLIFAFEKVSRYDKPFGKVVRTIEKRFYFDNGQLVKLTDGKKLFTDKNEEFTEAREQIADLSQKLLENARQ